ncbi:MAG: phosphomannomutase/phosphoglucomutase [Phototrophicaceae bacterium]
MSINPKIFRKYDIRGKSDSDLTDEVVTAIGRAVGTYFQNEHNVKKVIVGRDNRLSGKRLRDAFTTGIVSTGSDVLDIGICSTPTLYWYAVKEDTAGVMITGSHLDAIFNGFKIAIGNVALYGEGIQAIYDLIADDEFAEGNGSITLHHDSLTPYISDVSSKVSPKKLNVAVDPGNGSAGLFVDAFMSNWGQDAVTINMDLDGSFPNHDPDPSKAKNLAQLVQLVRDNDADVGLAFDGDADRVVAIDELGNVIAPDRFVAILAKDVLTRHPEATIIGDVTSSQALFDTIKEAGGNPVMWMTGHSLIKEKMRETGAILAGEISGHIFFAEDYYGFDDAYLAAGKLLQILGNSEQSLSEMDAEIPTYYSTKVFRPECDPEINHDVLAALSQDLGEKGELILLDGIRAQFDAGWVIIRESNTEPVLSIRIEGKTREDAMQYRDWVVEILAQFEGVELGDLTGEI